MSKWKTNRRHKHRKHCSIALQQQCSALLIDFKTLTTRSSDNQRMSHRDIKASAAAKQAARQRKLAILERALQQ